MSCASTGCRRDKKKDTQDTGKHWCARLCPARPQDIEETRKRHTGHGRALVCSLVSCTSMGYQRDKTHRTQASTGVLAHVLCIHGMSKTQEKNYLHNMGKHLCARSCPARPRDIKETHRTRASTGVLARVLRIHGMLKRQEKNYLHNMGKHRCARPMLTRALGIRAMSKR